ncbi:type 1 periplasmic-binding domain-containing protein [Herbiconiux daphne]|uniref:BMP family ABC transporter substrate-binding protein n=1 Tax=Herbiconiux daphne TaxID=2970914 RepID=UPI00217E6BCD|nr:BMP family ABC transporter substrate-binding protein [Herbiconiux daphne]
MPAPHQGTGSFGSRSPRRRRFDTGAIRGPATLEVMSPRAIRSSTAPTRTPGSPRSPRRTGSPRSRGVAVLLAAAAAVVAAGVFAAGCAAITGVTNPAGAAGAGAAASAPIAALDDGFLGAVSPTPEATISPEPGSWNAVTPPAGYRVVLISAGDDSATTTLSTAVRAWAEGHDVVFQQLRAMTDDEVEERIDQAAASEPDLVIGAGAGVVDVFALITGQYLAQQFLVLGAELPEPTANVTSVIWPGAMFRGTGLGSSGEIDPTSVTARRARDAIAAGSASVLHGHTGIVLDLG